PPRHGLPRPGQRHDHAADEVRLARELRVHRPRGPRDGRGRLGNRPGPGPREGPGADHGRAVRGHPGDAAQAPGDGEGRLARGPEDRRQGAARALQPLHAEDRPGRPRPGRAAGRDRRPLHPPQFDRAHRHDLAVAGQQRLHGIEPSFAHHYSRNVIREGKKTKEKVDVWSYELLAYRHLINPKAMPFSEDPEAKLPDYFVSADDITPKEHVDVQAAAQEWVDSSISKTANVPTDYPYEDFKDIYRYAYQKGLKGCTTFRFNPAAFQGVLVKETDL